MLRDFLEANMYLHDVEDDETIDLMVTCRDRSMLVFRDVRTNPVRYDGMWSIRHDFHGRLATSYIPVEDVWHFTIVSPNSQPVGESGG